MGGGGPAGTSLQMARYKYAHDRYNRFDVLRVNALTVVAVLFLARHVLSFIVIGIAFSRIGPGPASAFSGLFEPIFMLADIPAILVLLAMLSRHPKSGRIPRFIWRAGPFLLVVSAVTYLGLVAHQTGGNIAQHGWMLWAMIGGTVMSSAYVVLSPYARDLFRGYPAPEADESNGKRP